MSHKFVGSVGKELRGNKERALQLIGPARLLVQQALDKIEARGGSGQQLEQWRSSDGCVVWAYVIKYLVTPIVRIFIECPGGEKTCSPQLVDMGVWESEDTYFYFSWNGRKEAKEPVYHSPVRYWIGQYKSQAIIVINHGGSFVVGDTTIARFGSYSSQDAFCIKTFEGENGGDYFLVGRRQVISEDLFEVWIYGAPLVEDGVATDFQLLWKIPFSSYTSYYATLYDTQFSATGAKLVFLRRSATFIYKVYDADIPLAYPEVNDGVPVVTTLGSNELFEYDPPDIYSLAVWNVSDFEGPSGGEWEAMGTNGNYGEFVSYDSAGQQGIGSLDYSLTLCHGTFFEGDILHLVKSTVTVSENYSITQSKWDYIGRPHPVFNSHSPYPVAAEELRISFIGTIFAGRVGYVDLTSTYTLTASVTVDFGLKSVTEQVCDVSFTSHALIKEQSSLYAAELWLCHYEHSSNTFIGYVDPVTFSADEAVLDSETEYSMDNVFVAINAMTGYAGLLGDGITVGPTVYENYSFSGEGDYHGAYSDWAEHAMGDSPNLLLSASSINRDVKLYLLGDHIATEEAFDWQIVNMHRYNGIFMSDPEQLGYIELPPYYQFGSGMYPHVDTRSWSSIKWPEWVKDLYPPRKVPPNAVVGLRGIYIPGKTVSTNLAFIWPAVTCWPEKKEILT